MKNPVPAETGNTIEGSYVTPDPKAEQDPGKRGSSTGNRLKHRPLWRLGRKCARILVPLRPLLFFFKISWAMYINRHNYGLYSDVEEIGGRLSERWIAEKGIFMHKDDVFVGKSSAELSPQGFTSIRLCSENLQALWISKLLTMRPPL